MNLPIRSLQAQDAPESSNVPLPAATSRSNRKWIAAAISKLVAESRASEETPLIELPLPGLPLVRLLMKDESVHPSGSLKHRLARSLFLYALCNGRLRRGQAIVDCSTGSTAISEGWFARRLGLPFVAVMPRGTASAKQGAIAALGGRCELIEPGEDAAARAKALAQELDACYLDQFGEAASATDWRGNNNIAQSILQQCRQRGIEDPDWIVCGAGTGGTSATIGRYLRYVGKGTRICVADPSGCAFAAGWRSRDRSVLATRRTCIEGIGRPRVEPCFNFELADAVIEVDDEASIAGAWWLERQLGRRFGGSSGTNLVASLQLAESIQAAGRPGSVVMLLCDRGERYADTLFDPRWLEAKGIDLQALLSSLDLRAGTRAPA